MHWTQLCEHLPGLIPPEVTHYQNNTHPGMGWYLHTVIPHSVDHVINQTWQHVIRSHPAWVCTMPTAYDWLADVIPHSCSVWFRSPHYVHVLKVWPDCAYEIWSQDQAFNYWGTQIAGWAQSENSHAPDIHKLMHVTQFMQTHVSAHQAAHKRSQFRVIAHDQKDSGSAHPRSNMDPV